MKFWHSLQIQSVSNPLSEPCFSHHLLPNSLFDQILYLLYYASSLDSYIANMQEMQ